MRELLAARAKKPDKFFNSTSVTILRDRIENYKRFFHWPALIESLERDLAELEKLRLPKKKSGRGERGLFAGRTPEENLSRSPE